MTSWRSVTLCSLAVLLSMGCDDDEEDLCAFVDCGSHGTCDVESGACLCHAGYAGARCDECALDCGEHGSCDLESVTCECDEGWAGSRCEACAEGYAPDGDDCVPAGCTDDEECDDDLLCNGVETCGDDRACVAGEPIVCGEHEICVEPNGTCSCEPGYDRVDEVCLREVLADLEDLELDAESFWNGADGSGSFRSGSVTFYNSYVAEWTSWDGFAYSNVTDTTTPGIENQYAAIAGSGAAGSATYAVAYESAFSTIGPPTLEIVGAADDGGMTIAGAYVTNTTFAYLSMRDGDAYCKRFGGETGTDPDWFLLTIHGIRSDASLTDPVEFYLADFRSDDGEEDYIVDEWTFVDLSSLGDVVGLQFTLSSSDVGDWGMNTPAYFALDGLMRHGR